MKLQTKVLLSLLAGLLGVDRGSFLFQQDRNARAVASFS